MKRMRRFLSLIILPLSACAVGPVGGRHTSDATLEHTFEAHQTEFEALRDEFEANSQLRVLFAGDRVDLHLANLSAMERAGLPRERTTYYEDQLHRLGLWSVGKGGRGIEFRVDPSSNANGDSLKGYWWYREGEPRDVRPSLDNYRFSNKDEIVYKVLKGHWYLYIFVNH
jgi:hypothetical protein